jgi:hypothetical protein
MKKIILISFLTTCFFYNSIAQIDVDIKGGINVAAVKGLSDGGTNNLLLSFNTGLLAQFYWIKTFRSGVKFFLTSTFFENFRKNPLKPLKTLTY